MLYIGQIIGPWKIIKILKKNSTFIANVFAYNTPNEDLINYLYNEKNWIMKLREIDEDYNEINKIEKYKLKEFEYAVKFPKNIYYHYGIIYNYLWYVMEKFEGDCYYNSIDNIKDFTIDVINFLKYIHCKFNAIHHDLKLQNVLVKNNIYRVCDYESITSVRDDYILNKKYTDRDYHINYYYYSFGCEFNKSFYSYRYDLEAFGYMLWNLIIKDLLPFQKEAHKLYAIRCNEDKYENLEKLKLLDEVPNIIKMYKEIINRLDWFSKITDDSIYNEIINLISTNINIIIN